MTDDKTWIWLDPETLKAKQREKTAMLSAMLKRLVERSTASTEAQQCPAPTT